MPKRVHYCNNTIWLTSIDMALDGVREAIISISRRSYMLSIHSTSLEALISTCVLFLRNPSIFPFLTRLIEDMVHQRMI